jgi:hypothetical protein
VTDAHRKRPALAAMCDVSSSPICDAEVRKIVQHMTLYTLKVTLIGTKPPIWRRVEVPADISLEQLHHIVQIAMGWTNSHLHLFERERVTYCPPDPDIDHPYVDERTTRLGDVLRKPKDRMKYEYDFGDGWLHHVVLERVTATASLVPARVVKAQGACPPEDVGGVHGFARFMEIMADPQHEAHADMLDWHGRTFDPEAYDIADVNAQLSRRQWRAGSQRFDRHVH